MTLNHRINISKKIRWGKPQTLNNQSFDYAQESNNQINQLSLTQRTEKP